MIWSVYQATLGFVITKNLKSPKIATKNKMSKRLQNPKFNKDGRSRWNVYQSTLGAVV